MAERIILGIDPGTNIMGYGLIIDKGKSIELIKMDVIKLNKIENQPLKLKMIFETTLELIDTHKPDEFSIEAPFYGKNVQSMLKLGRAQGVAMAAALFRSVPIFEYSPKKIKQSITGNGNASKEQVAAMLFTLLKYKEAPKYLDATDGLAVAVCHYFQKSPSNEGTKYSGWKSFLTNNPERLLK
ncbi:MAG: crossover junction endodeoxyribonuclease RuvC [Bacteroidales bacterium]|jgi:crossover junction endodeoxyribonuclease RuvC